MAMWYPGTLDSIVEGCLATGEKPIDYIIHKRGSELLSHPKYTLANLKACGTASYQRTISDTGNPGSQP